MVKGGKLTKSEKFYIQQNPEKKTIHELATELDRNPSLIGKYITVEVPQEELEEEQKKVAEPKPESAMFQLMGRHERQGKHVATVMTKAASELADSTRPARIKNKKIQAAIHKPIS